MVRSAIVATLAVVANCSVLTNASGQDPTRDLPAKRVPGVTAEKALDLGLQRLRAGWHWEAARMFREMMVRDESKPLPHLLMALAMRDVPNRAARHCYDAMTRRDAGAASTQKLISAYQSYFGVTDQPELKDARFAKVPSRTRADALVMALAAIEAKHAGVATELIAVERWLLRAKKDEPVVHAGACGGEQPVPQRDSLLAHHNAYVDAFGAMPFMVPGYHRVASKGVGLSVERLKLARIPRHPDHSVTHRVGSLLPGFQVPTTPGEGTEWQPRKATAFELQRGLGGKAKLSDYSGKPVLVVFFLGFGCAHCVAQLADLDPKSEQFREAGIEVVSIGTDDLNQVRAARQAADENGVDPLHFDVLCDPKGGVFKQWGVWDEFSDEALHGTFLVDGKGRILWQDISLRPFEESDWLLAESKRLLAAWQDP